MVILPMAGFSRRFVEAGFDRPKYELMLAGRPVLDWSLLSFRRWFGKEQLTLVFRDTAGTRDFAEERVAACGISDVCFVPLDHPTKGQAETVALGIAGSGAASTEPLTIFNIDTLRPGLPRPSEMSLPRCDGYLETFIGTGSHWSFVEPQTIGDSRAKRVVEKVRISEYCCTGLYHFASVDLFSKSFLREANAPSANELFVAPLFQHLISDNLDIRFTVIERSEVFFCGTPLEYNLLLEREADILSAFEC